jgi:hypothetical protein
MGMGGEGSARRRPNWGDGKVGTAGPAQAHGKGRRGGGWSTRGEEGHGRGTVPGTVNVSGALCGNRGGAGTGTWGTVWVAAGPAAMG